MKELPLNPLAKVEVLNSYVRMVTVHVAGKLLLVEEEVPVVQILRFNIMTAVLRSGVYLDLSGMIQT